MTERAFPLIISTQVSATAEFYEQLGFVRQIQNPPTGEPSFVGLRRDATEIAIVDTAWPKDQYGGSVGTGTRYEMFVFVDEVDTILDKLRHDGVPVLREPVTMPWGERVAHVADPDGNAVALASAVRRG
jgi:lactoylglutathione lyase